MGRKRTKNKHLPQRVYVDKHGTYRYYPKTGKPIVLARRGNFSEAMREYGLLDLERPDGRLMSDILDRFNRERAGDYSRPGDIRGQIANLRAVFGDMSPMAIKPRHVYEYMDLRSQSSESQALKEKSTLSSVMQQAIIWGYIDANPCREVEGWKLPSRDRRITDEEFNAVYDIAPRAVQIVMDVSLLTGLRLSDVLGLRVADCQDDGIHVTIGKSKPTKRTRKKRSAPKKLIIEWSDDLRKVVTRAKERPVLSPWLITNTKHRPYTLSGFESVWRRWRDKSGVKDFRFHDIRHKTATDMANNKEAARLLAHSDSRMTAKVYNNAPEKVRPLQRKKET